MESDSNDEMADYEELLLLQLIQKNLNANFLIIYCSYKRKSFVSLAVSLILSRVIHELNKFVQLSASKCD